MRHLLIFVPLVVDIFVSSTCTNLIAFDCAAVLNELHLEKHICILEKPFFQGHDHELRSLEVLLNHQPNVLSVAQVQRGINLIQNIQGGRMVLE